MNDVRHVCFLRRNKKEKPPRTVVDRISADDDGQPDEDSNNECNGRKVSIGRITIKRGFPRVKEKWEEERERKRRGRKDDKRATRRWTDYAL